MGEYLLGFDIGGTKCAVVLGRPDGEAVTILARAAFANEGRTAPGEILPRLIGEARAICAARGIAPTDVHSLGVSCGGPLDSRRGVILGPPNLPGWDRVPIVDECRAALGIPVRLQNDANAGALAEWRWGAGRGCRHLIFLTFGTGMGAGLILDGRLYTGAGDLAGEVGHIRLAEDGPVGYGKAGSFEGFCSGGGLAAAGRALSRRLASEATPPTAQAIAEAAAAGDVAAREIIDASARYLGRGLAMLVDLINPERIVIGGIFARQRDLFWPLAQETLAAEALPLARQCCAIVPAQLGEAIDDYAALAVALAD